MTALAAATAAYSSPAGGTTAISIRRLGKAYTIRRGLESQTTLAEQALARIKNPFHRAQTETFWALRDIDLDIQQGEVVGIIGRNGAGKSTLLKLLSRITAPTEGRIEINGRVGSLLEVGTGFHPELTGRENIFLNGAVLGMTRPEIKREFDAIVEFAGVERFLETPVKRYSSGMYVRLAFAVAAHLRTEVLIVDEVLAVGDAEFQKKCLGKMQDVASGQGRTVLFVSHQMHNIAGLCERVAVLESGQLAYLGDTHRAIEIYLNSSNANHSFELSADERAGREQPSIWSAETLKTTFAVGEAIEVNLSVGRQTSPGHDPACKYYVAGLLVDSQGRPVTNTDSRLMHDLFRLDRDTPTGRFRLRMDGLWLKPGQYSLDLAVCGVGELFDRVGQAVSFSVEGELPYPRTGHDLLDSGVVLSDFGYEVLGGEEAPRALAAELA